MGVGPSTTQASSEVLGRSAAPEGLVGRPSTPLRHRVHKLQQEKVITENCPNQQPGRPHTPPMIRKSKQRSFVAKPWAYNELYEDADAGAPCVKSFAPISSESIGHGLCFRLEKSASQPIGETHNGSKSSDQDEQEEEEEEARKATSSSPSPAAESNASKSQEEGGNLERQPGEGTQKSAVSGDGSTSAYILEALQQIPKTIAYFNNGERQKRHLFFDPYEDSESHFKFRTRPNVWIKPARISGWNRKCASTPTKGRSERSAPQRMVRRNTAGSILTTSSETRAAESALSAEPKEKTGSVVHEKGEKECAAGGQDTTTNTTFEGFQNNTQPRNIKEHVALIAEIRGKLEDMKERLPADEYTWEKIQDLISADGGAQESHQEQQASSTGRGQGTGRKMLRVPSTVASTRPS